MSKHARRTHERTATAGVQTTPEPIDQHTTRCTILGIDEQGYHHVWDEARDRVVVIDADGIDHQEDLGGRPVADWIAFVDDRRGWVKVQHITAGWLYGGL